MRIDTIFNCIDIDLLGEAADADSGMGVRASPAFKNLVDGVADFLTLGFR